MRRLGLAILFFAANATAAPSKIEDLPEARAAATIGSAGAVSRFDAPYAGQCLLTTSDNRAIALRWIPEESAIERTTFSMYRKDEKGNLEREEPAWAYESIVRYESVNKVSPVKVVENGDVVAWAYREANSVVLVVPGKGGTTTTSGSQRGSTTCSMAMMVLSTKPASECTTTAGCGRFAQIGGSGYALTAGVSQGSVSATVRLFTASK